MKYSFPLYSRNESMEREAFSSLEILPRPSPPADRWSDSEIYPFLLCYHMTVWWWWWWWWCRKHEYGITTITMLESWDQSSRWMNECLMTEIGAMLYHHMKFTIMLLLLIHFTYKRIYIYAKYWAPNCCRQYSAHRLLFWDGGGRMVVPLNGESDEWEVPVSPISGLLGDCGLKESTSLSHPTTGIASSLSTWGSQSEFIDRENCLTTDLTTFVKKNGKKDRVGKCFGTVKCQQLWNEKRKEISLYV
jgi:hypothetical protein